MPTNQVIMSTCSTSSLSGSIFYEQRSDDHPAEHVVVVPDFRVQRNETAIDDLLKQKDLELKTLQIEQLKNQPAPKETQPMSTTSIVIICVLVSLIVVKFIAPRCTWANFFRAIVRLVMRPGMSEWRKIKAEWEQANKD